MATRRFIAGSLSLLITIKVVLPCLAQNRATAATLGSQSDAQWIASYAPGCSSTTTHCGTTSTFVWDPHFASLIRRSLTQEQSWWVDGHAGSASVLSLAKAYLGITDEKTYFDNNRFLSVSGCIPHACTVKGFLWIDTGAQSPTVLFVAEQLVVTASHEQDLGYHLWIYTSTNGNLKKLPPDFLSSLQRWHDRISASAPDWSPQTFRLVTIVARDGRMADVTYNVLLEQAHQNSSSQPGAKP